MTGQETDNATCTAGLNDVPSDAYEESSSMIGGRRRDGGQTCLKDRWRWMSFVVPKRWERRRVIDNSGKLSQKTSEINNLTRQAARCAREPQPH